MADSTINGLTATTGSAISQTADYLPIWDNAGATTKKINRTQFFNGPLTGDVGAAIRSASTDYSGVVFDPYTSSTRIEANMGAQTIGTTAFTMWVRFKCPTSIPASGGGTNPGLISFSANGVSTYHNYGFQIFLTAINELRVYRYGADRTVDWRQANVSNFVNTYGGQTVDVVVTRSGSTLKVYINGVDTSYVDTSGGTTPPSWADTVTSSYVMVGAQDSTKILASSIYKASVFNRALSASEVLDLCENGIDFADQWGNQSGQTSGTLSTSKNYRITTFVAGDSFTNAGASSNASGVEFKAVATTPTTWTNGSTLNRVGAIMDLDFTAGYGYQAMGRSTNAINATLINGVSWTQPQPRGVLFATTSTNGNQQLLGNLAIPSDATITAIYVNSNLATPTVTMGNASAGTQIFGSTALTGVSRQQITPSLPISTTGNLWVNSNSTATLNWTIEYIRSF